MTIILTFQCNHAHSVLFDFEHVEPVHNHHSLDQVAAKVAMSGFTLVSYIILRTSMNLPSIIHVGLQTHVIRAQVLNASLRILNPDTVLIHAQGFVALTD